MNEETVKKLLSTVDAGLVDGMGEPIPGSMCVEAAVCYALGLPHGDDPKCVSPALRALKIRLNDSAWSSNAARAKGLRRLAVLQLGTNTDFDEIEFLRRVVIFTCNEIVAPLFEGTPYFYALKNAKTLSEIDAVILGAVAAVGPRRGLRERLRKWRRRCQR